MNKNDIKGIMEVRELIALGVAGMFIALAIMGKIDPKIVEFVVISIISFYFASKGNGNANDIANNVMNQMTANAPVAPTAPNVVPVMAQAIAPIIESVIAPAVAPVVEPAVAPVIISEPLNDVPAQG